MGFTNAIIIGGGVYDSIDPTRIRLKVDLIWYWWRNLILITPVFKTQVYLCYYRYTKHVRKLKHICSMYCVWICVVTCVFVCYRYGLNRDVTFVLIYANKIGVFVLHPWRESVYDGSHYYGRISYSDNSLVSTSSIPMKLLVQRSPYNLSDNVYY